MSIVAYPRDFKEPLHPQIQKLLDAISDFEFTTPNGLVFKMADINAMVPVYLDTEMSRVDNCNIPWDKLVGKIDELQIIINQLSSGNGGGNSGSVRDKDVERVICKINSSLDYYRSLLAKLKKIRDNYLKTNPAPSHSDEVLIPSEVALLGYYTRKGRSHDPEIVLLMDTLGNKRENAKSVAITLVHEMFHAFYDYDLNQQDTDIPYVEEPLTEYAMLNFLDELQKDDKKYYRLYREARDNVNKKKTSLGVGHYGFGSYLWEYEKEWGETLEGIHWIEAFRKVKYKLSGKTSGYLMFSEPFQIGFYPFGDEYYQMKLLRCVLLNDFIWLQKDELPFGGTKMRVRRTNAYWSEVTERHAIVLDGDYSDVDTWYLFCHLLGYCQQIIIWDHFKCDNFAVIKNLKCARVKLSSHNYSFFQEKGGAIFDSSRTTLFYFPESTIKECKIPDGVTEIAVGAFDFCTALEHVEIPSSVNKIPEDAFKDCESLNEEIVFNQKLLWVPNNVTEYVVPSSVKEIGREAFRHCKRLRQLVIHSEVGVIPDKVFKDCESLQHDVVFDQKLLSVSKHAREYEIPDGVTTIYDAAFAHCRLLERLVIPASMKSIQSSAFDGNSCLHIKELVFKGNELPEADKRFFYVFGSSCVIWVPKGCKQTFKRRFQRYNVKEY